jgi:transcriptional pleiotropic regulator of transition state genes
MSRKAGSSRKIDNLGRLVIPKEIRDKLNWTPNDKLELIPEDDRLIVAKINKSCASCGTTSKLAKCGNVILCLDCAERIAKNILKEKEM